MRLLSLLYVTDHLLWWAVCAGALLWEHLCRGSLDIIYLLYTQACEFWQAYSYLYMCVYIYWFGIACFFFLYRRLHLLLASAFRCIADQFAVLFLDLLESFLLPTS